MPIEQTSLLAALKHDYALYLEDKGVKFPSKSQIGPLLCLYYHRGEGVSQETISKWCEDYGYPSYNKQARHLAASGWNLASGNRRTHNMTYDKNMKNNELRLISSKTINPNMIANRVNLISDSSFHELVTFYEEKRGGCAVCGRISRHPDGSHNYDKGHISRNKSAVNGNVAPICPSCNNKMQRDNLEWYLDESLVCSPQSVRNNEPNKLIQFSIGLLRKEGKEDDEILEILTKIVRKTSITQSE